MFGTWLIEGSKMSIENESAEEKAPKTSSTGPLPGESHHDWSNRFGEAVVAALRQVAREAKAREEARKEEARKKGILVDEDQAG